LHRFSDKKFTGCSGCPLFDKDANLTGFVHGEDKHRGKQSHVGGKNDSTSVSVFVDTFGVNGVKLLLVPTTELSCTQLQQAENNPPAFMNDPTDKISTFDYASQLTMAKQYGLGCLEQNLNDVMLGVADEIWSQNVEHAVEAIHLQGTVTIAIPTVENSTIVSPAIANPFDAILE
jgi:hypothetical protein